MTLLSIVLPTIDGRQDELVQTVAVFERCTPSVAGPIEWIVEVNHPNCGVAWNAGAARAMGKYLLLAADDLEPESSHWFQAAVVSVAKGHVPLGIVRERGVRFGHDFPRVPFCLREWWVDVAEIHYWSDNHFGDLMSRAGHSPAVAPNFDFIHRKSMVGRDESPQRLAKDHQAYISARRG